jgi:CheY-like chemotaxis protein
VATAATEDEALAACDKHNIALAIVDLQLAQGTGFGVIRRLRAATGAHPPASWCSPTTRFRRSRSPRSRRARLLPRQVEGLRDDPEAVGELLNTRKN